MRFEGSYGTAHIDGITINIDTAKVIDLKEHIKSLEITRNNLILEQNDYLGKIIDLKGDN